MLWVIVIILLLILFVLYKNFNKIPINQPAVSDIIIAPSDGLYNYPYIYPYYNDVNYYDSYNWGSRRHYRPSPHPPQPRPAPRPPAPRPPRPPRTRR